MVLLRLSCPAFWSSLSSTNDGTEASDYQGAAPAQSLSLPQHHPEERSAGSIQTDPFPLFQSALIPDDMNLDFDDDEVQESQSLVAQLTVILQSSVHVGGFGQDTVGESLEGLFALYEGQRKVQLLERVLSADLLLFGSQSPLFSNHARRFCSAALAAPRDPNTPGREVSVFGQALLVAMNPPAVL